MSSILRHYARYATGNALSLAAGFISFPILTRALDNHQFGLIGVLDGLLLLAVAIMKFGLGDAVLRFYPHGEGEGAFRRFLASLLVVPFLASLALWAVAMAALAVAAATGRIDHGAATLLAFAGVPLLAFTSYVQWLMAAQERSGINAATNTATRWSQTLLVVALVLLVAPTVEVVFVGRLIAALAIAAWVGHWLWRQAAPRVRDVDWKLTRAALVFSLPMAMVEITNIGFTYIDRVMLKALLGDFEAVGIYTIGASLAMYVGMIVNTTLTQSYAPVMNRLYIQEGPEAVLEFKRRTMQPMAYAVLLLVAGMAVVGEDFFHVISGPDKLASAPVFILLSITFVALSVLNIAGYGAMLAKQTGRLLGINSAGIGLNIALNLYLIPRYGVMGAVGATVLTRPLVATAVYLMCPTALRCLPPARSLATAFALALFGSAAAWIVLQTLPDSRPLVRLLAGGSVLVTCYLLPLIALSADARRAVRDVARRVRGARQPSA